jgi:chaperone BCS1
MNAINGVAAQEGPMLFMTTNHIERLHEASIRPGRVDISF